MNTTTLIVFLITVSIHGKKINEKERLEIIIEVNDKGLKRLNGGYKEFEDKGEDLLEEGHPFAEDLDIFGQNSLFQMINTTRILTLFLSITKRPSIPEAK